MTIRCPRSLLASLFLLHAGLAHAGLAVPNQPPVIAHSLVRTEPFVPVSVPVSVADPDAGSTPLTVTLAVQAVTSRAPLNVGRILWNRAASAGVTSDTETLTLSQLNQSLATLRFVSISGFAGKARVRIDVQDNAASSPAVATVFAEIDVCGVGDTTLAHCETNSAPTQAVGTTRRLPPGRASVVATSIEDIDVGQGRLEQEINLADQAGDGEPVTPVAQIGTFSWRSLTGLTSDQFVERESVLNDALATLQFVPHPDFVGTARLVFEVDDEGNSRLIDTGSPDDELAATKPLVLRVCGRDEFDDNVRCLRNDPPVLLMPTTRPRVDPRTPATFGLGVDDPDTGRDLDLTVTVSDPSGLLAASSVGRFDWAFGTNVTTDTATASLEALDAALAALEFTAAPGFAGRARLTLVVDDNGGTGSGGVKTTTASLDIDVCTAGEVGTAACLVNNPPTLTLGGAGEAVSGVSIAIPGTVADTDAGAALIDLAIAVTDAAGNRPPDQIGTLTWSFGGALPQVSATATLAALNAALQTLRFTPAANFTGDARVQVTVSDLGNSGSGGARTATLTRVIDVGAVPDAIRYLSGCIVPAAEGSVVSLVFDRLGGQGEANVPLSTGAGNAQPGVDYAINLSPGVTWQTGETGVRSFNIVILSDAVNEGIENFFVEAGPAVGAPLEAPPLIEIVIRNALGPAFVFGDGNEGECRFN